MLHDDRSENEQIPEDEFLAMGDGITLDDVDRHKKKKKHNYDCHHCGVKHLVCVLRCNNKYEGEYLACCIPYVTYHMICHIYYRIGMIS